MVQGIVLVTFPALSTIFTKASEYGLSSTQYGGLFLPQVVTAITASLLGAGLARRISSKRVYLIGLGCSTVAMGLLIVSAGVKTDQSAAYPLLLVATAFLGAGFGLTVPILNTYASVFHPDGVDRSVLVLNALLGLGTALAPVFVAVFVGLGFWWGLPILSAALLVALLAFSARLPLRAGARAGGAAPRAGRGVPARFWVFAAFAVLYGICETMNGNWSQLDLTTRVGASAAQASFALAVFWGMVTVGRVLFAAIGRWLPERVTYHILPFVLVVTFVLVAVLPRGDAGAGIAIFALAGLGCSALLPLTIAAPGRCASGTEPPTSCSWTSTARPPMPSSWPTVSASSLPTRAGSHCRISSTGCASTGTGPMKASGRPAAAGRHGAQVEPLPRRGAEVTGLTAAVEQVKHLVGRR
jgi:MFS family permease